MNFDALSNVEFGNQESLREMLFENGLEHKLFWETFADAGTLLPQYPLIDVDIDNLDDWLQVHQIEHQAFASALNLDNPFNLLDTDWNKEDDFYDWLSSHLYIHQLIASRLGLS